MGTPPSKFNLFDAEDRILAEAEALLRQADSSTEALHGGLEQLVQAYGLGIKEQRRLVKLSDRQQSQVSKLNKELAQRTSQAEDALAQLQAAKDQLVQAEKLASLGALVGGVAHEINTPVGVALSCATHLATLAGRLQTLYQNDDVGVADFEAFLQQTLRATDLMVDNCHRAAELIGSFKQVAVDRVSAERRTFDLDQKIRETLTSLGPQIKTPGCRVELDCVPGVIIDGYPGMVSQIIGNLVMNSVIHGFGDDGIGSIRIVVSRTDNGDIHLVVADDGKGIPAQNLDRVFDPFFSTKMGQGGSGLGLNIVYNLVTGPLGGRIAVTSAPGQGTQFSIDFPAIAPLAPGKESGQ